MANHLTPSELADEVNMKREQLLVELRRSLLAVPVCAGIENGIYAILCQGCHQPRNIPRIFSGRVRDPEPPYGAMFLRVWLEADLFDEG
jgi:hypothetical protein